MAEHSVWETGTFIPSAFNEHSKQNVQNEKEVLDAVFVKPSTGIVGSHVKHTSLRVLFDIHGTCMRNSCVPFMNNLYMVYRQGKKFFASSSVISFYMNHRRT
jgi:hypothetical protein